MNIREIREASKREFEAAKLSASETPETTPGIVTSKILNFASLLEADEPDYIPVVHDPHGLYGWCSDGVHQKILADGGTIVFGWTIWEVPQVFLTAEFHAVWEDASGTLVDITPKPAGETKILFARARRYSSEFDFDNRPRNRLLRIYERPNLRSAIEGRVIQWSKGKKAYEEKRAQAAGLDLLSWLEQKEGLDPLEIAIDEFLKVCDEFSEHYDSLGKFGLIQVDEKFEILARRKLKAQSKLRDLMIKMQLYGASPASTS